MAAPPRWISHCCSTASRRNGSRASPSTLPTASSPPGGAPSWSDAPGHEQYTRNMATGASNVDLAVILVDARKGLLPQTRRHLHICALFGIRHFVLAVNKMDLVGYDEKIFGQIAE